MEKMGFMTYIGFSHLGVIETLWHHFSGLLWQAWPPTHSSVNKTIHCSLLICKICMTNSKLFYIFSISLLVLNWLAILKLWKPTISIILVKWSPMVADWPLSSNSVHLFESLSPFSGLHLTLHTAKHVYG